MWKTICSVISPLSAVALFQCFLSHTLTSMFLGQGVFRLCGSSETCLIAVYKLALEAFS